MAKDDLKLKDLFTHLVDWIKGKFSEQDAKIATNKYTLPQATEYDLGGVKTQNAYPGERYSGKVVTEQYVHECSDSLFNLIELSAKPATPILNGTVKLLDNENSVLYPQYQGTAAGVSHVDNVIKSMEVGMAAQLNLKQDKIKIVTAEPTASSTASDPEGTIYFKV